MAVVKKYDFLIVGAGLYGCTIARLLADVGYKCLIIDKRNTIGGNCASQNINGIDVHFYGPHVFHTNNRTVWNFVNRFDEFYQYTHKAFVNYKGDYYNFPINKKTLQDFPGNDIFDSFIKSYSEKQWGCIYNETPASVINRLPFRENLFDSYFLDRWQGVPFDGYDAFFKKMTYGIDIELEKDFFESNYRYEKMIFTGPIDSFFDYKLGPLKWRSLQFDISSINKQDYQGWSVIHFPEKEFAYTRITEFKHFNPFSEHYNDKFTIIAKEYPCENSKEPYYPVPTCINIELYHRYRNLSQDKKNIFFAGRLGKYEYNNMDTTIENAIKDFENGIYF